MTQPHWATILLGGGGIVGGVISAVTLATDRLIKQKDETIKCLTRENDALQSQVTESRHTSNKILEQFREQLQNIDVGRFSDADKLRIQEVFGLLHKFGSVLKGFKDCEHAANWLDKRKQILAAEAAEKAVRRYKHLFLFPRNRGIRFQRDMEQYLEWVCVCLSKYGGRTVNVPITEFIKSSATTSPEPYVFAIKYLIDSTNFSELDPIPREYLREVLARSTKQLLSELKQQGHKSNLQVS